MNYSIRLIAMSLVIFASTQLNAQQSVLIKRDSTQKIQSLFQEKIKSFGLSVSPTFQFGSMGPQAGMSVALHLNNSWEIGGSFTRTMRSHRNDYMTGQLDQQFHALSIAYTAKANRLVHLSFPLLIGAIQTRDISPIAISDPNPMYSGYGGHYQTNDFYRRPVSLGIQPGVQLELNVLKHLRVFTGANYRFALGDNSTAEMQGFVGTLGLKVGLFDRPVGKKKK